MPDPGALGGSGDPGRPEEDSGQVGLSNVHSAGRTEGVGVPNEDHRWGQEGPHPRGSAPSRIRVGGWGWERGDTVGRVPALKQGRGRDRAHSLEGVHSAAGLGSRGQ